MKISNDQFNFLYKVYLVLIIQLIITYSILYYLRLNDNQITKILKDINIIFLIILSFIIILIFAFLPNNSSILLRLFVFFIFSIISGLLIYKVSKKLDDESIITSSVSTILIFIVMTIFAFILKKINYDIGFIGLYLIAFLIGLIIVQIVMIFVNPDKTIKKIILYIGIILFSIFVMYDTNEILFRYKMYNGNYVHPAMDFYLDFINIFIKLLSLENLE
jgi:FtsH-binding integral membrane protein